MAEDIGRRSSGDVAGPEGEVSREALEAEGRSAFDALMRATEREQVLAEAADRVLAEPDRARAAAKARHLLDGFREAGESAGAARFRLSRVWRALDERRARDEDDLRRLLDEPLPPESEG